MKITEIEMKERKQRVLNEAFQLFCQKGIEHITLAEIARSARVGEATIYRYFNNKPLLVLSTLSILWKSIGDSLEKKVSEIKHYDQMTGYEQIAAWLDGCKQLYLENSDYVLFSYESKLYLQRNNIKLTAEEYDSLMVGIKIPCVAAINKGKADGSIPVKEDSEDLFYAIWGSVRGYIVKIVIYRALCKDSSPWESRYQLMEDGILSALRSGWIGRRDVS